MPRLSGSCDLIFDQCSWFMKEPYLRDICKTLHLLSPLLPLSISYQITEWRLPLSLSKQPSYVAQQNDGISVRLCLCAPPGHVRRIRRPKIGFCMAMLVRKRQNWKEPLTHSDPFFAFFIEMQYIICATFLTTSSYEVFTVRCVCHISIPQEKKQIAFCCPSMSACPAHPCSQCRRDLRAWNCFNLLRLLPRPKDGGKNIWFFTTV